MHHPGRRRDARRVRAPEPARRTLPAACSRPARIRHRPGAAHHATPRTHVVPVRVQTAGELPRYAVPRSPGLRPACPARQRKAANAAPVAVCKIVAVRQASTAILRTMYRDRVVCAPVRPAVVSRDAMITAFHPLATFSVRFVRVLVSTAGEKVHAAGEKVTCEAPGAPGTGPRQSAAGRKQSGTGRDARAAWHRPAVADHRNAHRTGIQNQAADAT
jgi:hypothetical protein